MAKAADYLSQSGVEPCHHQPRRPQVHPLLHRRDALAAERGADRRLHGRDLETVQKMGRHPHRHHAECQSAPR